MAAGDRSWNLDLFRLWFSEEIINKIAGVPPPHPSFGPDKITWGATLTGSFSLKSAYGKIRKVILNLKEHLLEIPWKFKGPQRIYFFLWLTLKQRILTNAERVRQGIGSSSACGFCGQDYKDVLHVLRDCLAVKTIWDKLIPNDRLSSWAKQYIFISKIAFHKLHSYLHSSPLANSWVCLRTDGLVRLDEGFAAAGDYICDHNGGWIIGFCRYLGNCTKTEAKLWGILDVLNLLLER
ncbi:hypothetical protein Gorai_024047 [Gossypium raimondii]|uniref:Reverse transcriptase zinc-binding domain-containing protein n=1 Tax=Gossypium raimondii TaxID=29730 RepID=A0A7J8NXZ5_GOSRA|nr:hypothetical protein [Gossypium raimondii]